MCSCQARVSLTLSLLFVPAIKPSAVCRRRCAKWSVSAAGKLVRVRRDSSISWTSHSWYGDDHSKGANV
eukprot:99301-Karenia_brevis.AAC.1